MKKSLVFQNLKDSKKFLDQVSYESSLSQLQITIDNIKEEIPKYFKKNKEDVETILENSQSVPLKFGNVNVLLSITKYDLPQFDINNLNALLISSDDFSNNINYKYDFLQIIDEHKKDGNYTNNSQVSQTIEEYIKLTKDKDILKIKDDFTFIKDANITLLKCDCELKVDAINSNISFVFDLNSSSIKDFNIINIF